MKTMTYGGIFNSSSNSYSSNIYDTTVFSCLKRRYKISKTKLSTYVGNISKQKLFQILNIFLVKEATLEAADAGE